MVWRGDAGTEVVTVKPLGGRAILCAASEEIFPLVSKGMTSSNRLVQSVRRLPLSSGQYGLWDPERGQTTCQTPSGLVRSNHRHRARNLGRLIL
jgi:hypothetical protein